MSLMSKRRYSNAEMRTWLPGDSGSCTAGATDANVISIIVPTLNEERTIVGALTPLQPLRGRHIEIIVIDGGSADRTIDRARTLADRIAVANRGRAAQMNAGATLARGEVLLFLHSDTRLPQRFVELIHHRLSQPVRTWGRFDAKIDSRHPIFWIVSRMMNARSRWSGIATGDQAIFVRRVEFERLGGFPVIPLMEDIALSKALKRNSWPARISAPVITSARRWEQHGVLNTIFLMWRLRWAYFRGVDPADLAGKYEHDRCHG